MSAQSSDQGRVYQVGQGTMIVNTTTPRPVAVVTSIPGLDAAAPEVFVGRDSEVDELLAGLDPYGHSPSAVVVSAVAGMGGVGKSALAWHAAGIAVDWRWFPGGAVWVDLQGYEPTRRIEVGQVFGPLLRALGVHGDEIPVSDSEQAAAYHHLLGQRAEQGRRVLLVLDNASASDQVRDLLPRQRMHRAIVTTRDTLALPAAATLRLDVLDPDEAIALLDAALPEDARLAQDPVAAVRVVELCGRLPLAVRIVAGLLADDPGLILSDLAVELDSSTRLHVLAHGERAVAAAFDLSWQRLRAQHAPAAKLLRLLVLNPGPDLSTDAAAALASMPIGAVRPLLRVLREAHLVQQVRQRWRLHDLIRLHITHLPAECGAAEELASARVRLFRYYLRVTGAADKHLLALQGQPVPDLFSGRDAALVWLDHERANLIAVVENAASAGDHLVAVDLAIVLAEFMLWRGHFTEFVTVAKHASRAVRHIEDPVRQATTSTNLGKALHEVGLFYQAIDAHQEAVVLVAEAGDRDLEGAAWNNLGTVLESAGRCDEAIDAYQRSIAIRREIGDRHGEGLTWRNLGAALHGEGRLGAAVDADHHAIVLLRETGDRNGEGRALHNLGLVLRGMDWFEEAIDAYRHAIARFRDTDDRHREGQALMDIGMALWEVGRSEEARDCLHDAVEAYTASGAPEDGARVRELLDGLS